MKYISLPCNVDEGRQLSFFLSMEEYVARHINESDCFFMWQVEPTVIFGRNQVMQSEVNVDYCKANHINMFRRKSGGGCVYADRGNVMMSYICNSDNVNIAYNRFMGMLLLVLRRMGVEAVGSSHNDVMIADRKVSGTACYQLPGRSIVHATMLYDTNMEHMTQSITPPPEKLQKRGIQSVRQRITLLKDHISLTLDELKTFTRSTLCEGERMLTLSDVAAIEQIEQEYIQQNFITRVL